MREEIQTEADGPGADAPPPLPNSLVKWLWPALGSLSLGAIVVMILQSPELASKLGIHGVSAPKPPHIVSMTTPGQKPPAAAVSQGRGAPGALTTGGQPPKAKAPAAPAPGELTSVKPQEHHPEYLTTISTRLKDQDVRIKKLETILGGVTGSVGAAKAPAAGDKTTSSSVAKMALATNSADVDHTHKTDSLNLPAMPGKIKTAKLLPIMPPQGDIAGDTDEAARKAPPPAQAAARSEAKPADKAPAPGKTAALAGPDSPEEDLASGGQFGVRLVIADQVSKLKKAWQGLSADKKGNELSSFKPRVQKSRATNGKPIYALVAGPLSDIGEAIELCARLKLKGIPCAQSDFTGEPL